MAQEQQPDREAARRRETRHVHQSIEERRAHRTQNSPGRETPGKVGEPTDGVLTQVCEQCGKEYHFDTEPAPSDLSCEKCGGVVFRSFFSPKRYDDVEDDYHRSTDRDVAPNDDEADITRGDIIDLNNP